MPSFGAAAACGAAGDAQRRDRHTELLEFHVIGSWNPDIVPGARAAMGGGKARTSRPQPMPADCVKDLFNCGVDLYRGRGRICAYRRPSQFSFANYASARLFVANTILLRNLFS
jgi:hypothetical protein